MNKQAIRIINQSALYLILFVCLSRCQNHENLANANDRLYGIHVVPGELVATDYRLGKHSKMKILPEDYDKYLGLRYTNVVHSFLEGYRFKEHHLLPEDLYHFKNIKCLYFGDISYSSRATIEAQIDFTNFPELQEIFINANIKVDDFYKDLFEQTPNLRGIRANGISEIPECVCEYDKLEWIEITGQERNALKIPNCLKKNVNLKYISVTDYTEIDENLFRLPSLEYLRLGNIRNISNDIDFSKMTQLRGIEISKTPELKELSSLTRLKKLESIQLSNLRANLPQDLDCSQLKYIELFGVTMDYLLDFNECDESVEVKINQCKVGSKRTIFNHATKTKNKYYYQKFRMKHVFGYTKEELDLYPDNW